MSNQPLEFRIGQLEASVEHLNGAFEQIDKRLGDLRADTIAGFARVDQRLDGIERKFDGIEGKFDGIERKFDGIERKFDVLNGKVDGNFRTVATWMIAQTGVILAAIATVAFSLRH